MAKVVRRYPKDAMSTFDRDCQWFADHEKELLDQYGGQFVAVVAGKVVDCDPDFEKLARRVYEKYGYRDLLMSRVGEETRTLRGPGPRIAGVSG